MGYILLVLVAGYFSCVLFLGGKSLVTLFVEGNKEKGLKEFRKAYSWPMLSFLVFILLIALLMDNL